MAINIENDAYRYAIKNAFEHKGKAEIGAMVGKLKALHKDKPVPELMPFVIEAVKKVNSMPLAEIEEEFRKMEGNYELKPKPGREGLPELDWAEKGEKVVTRYAPNPNGPLHLGNARAAYLSYLYAEKYSGKFILRFEDTDPKVKKPIADAEKVFREDLSWLGIKVGEVYYASDRLEKYYDYMRKLVEMGKAYVCKCDSEKWRLLTQKKKPCPHRGLDAKEELAEFEKMLRHELKEGSAVLRIKTDLNNPDPSVRDWWLARIIDNPEHPRAGTSKHLWPSYMFQSAIDDHEMGITFILRGQEHSQNQTKQEFLYSYFGWKYPHAVHFGRLKIGTMVLSTSKIKEGIENGEYLDWDDIRLGTIRALRRRGFKAEALKKIIIDSGLNTNDAGISTQKLASYNQALIQDDATRITFITDPIKLQVPMQEEMVVEKDGMSFTLPRGMHEFFVSEKEVKAIKEPVFRIRNCYNVRVEKKDGLLLEGVFAGKEATGKKVLPWVLDSMDLELLLGDGSRVVGATEAQELKKGEYIYIEKKGYCIIDSVDEGRPKAWFSHE